jgi:hypothetical protein
MTTPSHEIQNSKKFKTKLAWDALNMLLKITQ